MPSYPWLSVFRQAQEESELSRLQARVTEAEETILMRMQDLRARDEKDAETQSERRELRAALNELLRIKTERLHRNSFGPRQALDAQERRAGPIRIVLADDSEVLLRTLTRFLNESSGVALVGVAADAREAMHVLRERQPHVLLFDLNMAVRNEDLCDDFKSASEHAVLVAISMEDDEDTQKLAERCGAACLVDKMKMHDQLVPAIVRSVATRSHPPN
jgi:CheY-like chemotaxis protein